MEQRILQQIFIKSNTLYLTEISDKVLLRPKRRHLFYPWNTPGQKKSFFTVWSDKHFCYETDSSLQFSLESGCE